MTKGTKRKSKKLETMQILGNPIPLPLRFSSPLPFSPEDKRKMPWLNLPTRTYQVIKEIGKCGRATAFRGNVLDNNEEKWKNSADIVIKIPNIDIDSPYTIVQIRDYLERQNRESGSEWQ